MAEGTGGHGKAKKNRCVGTHLQKCARYKASGRREKNKLRKESKYKQHLYDADQRRKRNHQGFTKRELRRHPEYRS